MESLVYQNLLTFVLSIYSISILFQNIYLFYSFPQQVECLIVTRSTFYTLCHTRLYLAIFLLPTPGVLWLCRDRHSARFLICSVRMFTVECAEEFGSSFFPSGSLRCFLSMRRAWVAIDDGAPNGFYREWGDMEEFLIAVAFNDDKLAQTNFDYFWRGGFFVWFFMRSAMDDGKGVIGVSGGNKSLFLCTSAFWDCRLGWMGGSIPLSY